MSPSCEQPPPPPLHYAGGGRPGGAEVTDRPDFLCIGQPKAGTGWLYDQLALHPGFWMPTIKELHYLDGRFPRKPATRLHQRLRDDPNFVKRQNRRRAEQKRQPLDRRDKRFARHAAGWRPGPIDLEWYAGLFAPKGALLSGDVTPGYGALPPETVAAVAARWPELRLVLMIREPVARFWSHLNMLVRQGHLDPEGLDWARVEAVLNRPGWPERSSPTTIHARWRRCFPAEQLHLVFFDDLARDPDAVLAGILRFLGAEPAGAAALDPSFNRKAGRAKLPLPPEIEARLRRHFRPEVEACAKTFGGPAEAWLAAYEAAYEANG